MPYRTQRRFSVLSVNSSGRIIVNCRKNGYFVHSKLSPSSGKCSFKIRRKRKVKKNPRQILNMQMIIKQRLQKLQFIPTAHILCYFAFDIGKAYAVRTCPEKTCTKCTKGVCQSSFFVVKFTCAEILHN